VITDSWRVPLARRAWIGDGEHGALISADGTLDWHSSAGVGPWPSCWRLLDPQGCAIRVGPVRDGGGATKRLPPSTQRYLPGTNIVETVMEGQGGRRVQVLDLMPWSGPGQTTSGQIVRLVRALSGPVEVEIEVYPPQRPARRRPVTATTEGVVFDRIEVRAAASFESAPIGRDLPRWRAVVGLDTGQELTVTIAEMGEGAAISAGAAHRLIDETEKCWRSWLSPLCYTGPYRPAVERSLLAVRSLTAPSGAVRAAGTTSLPRRVGSERTADDRWVHVRDVAASVRILAQVGLSEDAEAAESSLRRTIEDAPLPWPSWLDTTGQPVPEAEEMPFAGWRRGQPVSFGRPDPSTGVDLGIFGDVAASVGASMRGPYARPDDPGPLSAAFPALTEAADYSCDHWSEPDAGRWEVNEPKRNYVATQLQVWLGLDRLARLARSRNPLDLSAPVWQAEARRVLDGLERNGLAPDGGLRMDSRLGAGDEADAALLSVAWQGPWPDHHPIVVATVGRVVERLGSGPYLHRLDEDSAGDLGPDSPDLLATLLAVKALCRLERWEEAHTRMEAVAGLGDDTGLLSECVDALSGELLGNLPHTGTGLALVDAALALAEGPS
jgi:GH15 family glucan-1,4-alpha-glucosidase